jgi:hypothetical protein
MAKKTTAKEQTQDERVAIITLKGPPEYREWTDSISESTLIPLAVIFRDAIAAWAAERRLPPPPPTAKPGRPRRRLE